MTSVYTAGPDGRCAGCQRPKAEHRVALVGDPATPMYCHPEAASRCETGEVLGHQDTAVADVDLLQPTNTLRAMRLCERCGLPLVDHPVDGCPFATARPGPESDRDDAAHTLTTAQAEIARYQALVVEWRTATRELETARSRTADSIGSRLLAYEAIKVARRRLVAAERALVASVPEVAS